MSFGDHYRVATYSSQHRAKRFFKVVQHSENTILSNNKKRIPHTGQNFDEVMNDKRKQAVSMAIVPSIRPLVVFTNMHALLGEVSISLKV